MNSHAREIGKLEGRVAIVTGAAMGIGRATAYRLAEEGATIVAADISADPLEQTAASIRQMKAGCLSIITDVTNSEQVAEMVERSIAEFGKIDILVNNAGGDPGSTSQVGGFRLDENQWDSTYALNLKSQFIVTSLVVPHMKARNFGKIVNLSSGSPKVGDSHRIAYSAAKAGVISMTRGLARELGKYNINVNAVCPGPVWTPQWERDGAHLVATIPAYSGLTPRELFERIAAKVVLLGRGQEPEDIASVIAFLVSEDARAITGQSINVDGGVAFD